MRCTVIRDFQKCRYHLMLKQVSIPVECVPPACCPFLPACTAAGGGLLGWGWGCSWGVCSRGDVYPSMQWGRQPPVDRILDTRFWKYYLVPTTGMHSCLYYLWLGIYWDEPHWIGITDHHWFRSLMLIQLCKPDMCWREDSLKWILFHAPLHSLDLDYF